MKGGSIILLDPAAWGSIPSTPVIFLGAKVADVDEVNHQCFVVRNGR